MSVLEAPGRTAAQRLDALAAGNHVRSYRAGVKTRLRHGGVRINDLLLDPAPEIETMRVYALLTAVPKIGRVKADQILRRHLISPSKTVGGLSDRQRSALVAALLPYSVRYARRMDT